MKASSVKTCNQRAIWLNKATHDLIGNAETVELLYDRDRNVVALRRADDLFPHAYVIPSWCKRELGQALVSPPRSPATTAITPRPLGGKTLL